MGGDHGGHGPSGGDFRQKVWSMTGGPYCRPVHWRRNTAIAMVGIFLVCIPIAMKSAELEVRLPLPSPPTCRCPIHPLAPAVAPWSCADPTSDRGTRSAPAGKFWRKRQAWLVEISRR